MDLYIEKEFLDSFYYNFNNDPINNIVANIIKNYGDKNVFINYNIDDFLIIKNNNLFFAQICETSSPIPVKCIKESLFKSSFNQSLVFTYEEKDWFKQAEQKGALCFNYNNYANKINDIIEKLHFRIDLSEGFKGWNFLDNFNTLNYNQIVITDGYILVDRINQKTDENIIPILKKLKHNKSNLNVIIFTKDINAISEKDEHKKEKARKRYNILKNHFPDKNLQLTIIMNDIQNKFDFHDRVIQTNYSLLGCGKGFNLYDSKVSNSEITSETIFVKYTYDRLKNHKNMQNEYLNKLINLETLQFKMYPI